MSQDVRQSPKKGLLGTIYPNPRRNSRCSNFSQPINCFRAVPCMCMIPLKDFCCLAFEKVFLLTFAVLFCIILAYFMFL